MAQQGKTSLCQSFYSCSVFPLPRYQLYFNILQLQVKFTRGRKAMPASTAPVSSHLDSTVVLPAQHIPNPSTEHSVVLLTGFPNIHPFQVSLLPAIWSLLALYHNLGKLHTAISLQQQGQEKHFTELCNLQQLLGSQHIRKVITGSYKDL